MPLSWGRHYVMVEPTHFRIDYVINPFMDPANSPTAGWRGPSGTPSSRPSSGSAAPST